MRQTQLILLIDTGNTIGLQDEGRRLPSSLVHLASCLSGNGFKVALLLEDIMEQLCALVDHVPVLVGITMHSFVHEIRMAIQVGRWVSEHWPDVPVVIGGWHATVFPESMYDDGFANVIVRGSGERFLLSLVRHLCGGAELETFSYPGVSRSHGKIIKKTISFENEPSLFPVVDFDLLDPFIAKVIQNRRIHWLASRGCLNFCKFCAAGQCSKGTVAHKNVQQLIDEMQTLYGRYNVKEFHFSDSCLFSNTQWAQDFSARLIASPLQGKIRWRATARAKDLLGMDNDCMSLLRASGLANFVLGFESGSDNLLAKMNKRCSRDEIEACVARLKNEGFVRPLLFFMTEFPGESRGDLKATIQLIGEIKRLLPDSDISIMPFVPISPPFRRVFSQVSRLAAFADVLENRERWSSDVAYKSTMRAKADFYAILARRGSAPRTSLRHHIRRIFRAVAVCRLTWGFLRVPVEWWCYRGFSRIHRLVMPQLRRA